MWPFRRRRRQEDYVGRHRPGAWAEVALPPELEGTRVDTVLDPQNAIVTIAPGRAAVAGAEPPPDPVPAPESKVRLGFADGTSMELCGESSRALQETASRLLAP